MITLRELKEKDAEFMLEWMHDRDIQNCFIKDMLSATIEDALEFCRKSKIPSLRRLANPLMPASYQTLSG